MRRAESAALLAARVLIAVLFLGGAAQKLSSPADVTGLLAGRGLPEWLIWPALAYDAVAGLMLLAGLWTGPLAVTLALYCAFTSLFHWIPADPWQITIFVKNWAIAGGCLALAVAGAGDWRIGGGNAKRARRRARPSRK